MTEAAPTGERALADHDADGDDDVSLLLGLSEEVLVHLVKIGRFTLTDVGHLRATCTALRGFFDRIRDTVNEYVAGDLSKYYPYDHWDDIDRAAENGHFELIQLLHEDEVKRGRVVRCTLDAANRVLRRGNWDAFVFLVRHRKEADPRGDKRSLSNVRMWNWENLTREQVLFLLDEAPGYVVGVAAMHVARGPIRRGELDLVMRLVPFVESLLLERLLELSFAHFQQSRDVFEAVFRECCGRTIDNVRLAMCFFLTAAASESRGLELLDLAFRFSPVALTDLPPRELGRVMNAAVNAAVIERLRSLGLRRTRVNPKADDVVYSIEKEGAECKRAELVELILRKDYAAAEVAVKHMPGDEVFYAAYHLAKRCAVEELKWIHARAGVLTGECLLNPTVSARTHPLTAEYVEFAWPLLDSLPRTRWGDACHDPFEVVAAYTWFEDAVAQGDVALLRRLCECIDVAAAFAHESTPHTHADQAVAAGHADIVSYMIDVNARIVPVKDSAAARRRGAFDLRTRPFELTRTLDVAVRAGNLRLARMIDGRVPGLRASLASACLSRRWRVVRWVLGRLNATECAQQLSEARAAALKARRMEFVRWIDSGAL